ncbi:glycoside hydrolase family 17 protein [Pluteus cervinus]|uniref:Glycoside hydrolase family 17 protein n=1 Tax=Pluteus cervinus TaxID=181527 RepID=A0ACD3B1D1_9AGAR|nr:glycoside hydrolase family 17 protein [Pluteus cervinus]
MPASVPSKVNGWWCDPKTEYAFIGFGYEITPCQSQDQLTQEFTDIRKRFNGRYVRLYGTCDSDGYYNTVIEAAWSAGIGVHALIWFGFNGDNAWEGRRDALFSVLHSNPKAPYVVRTIQFGSEPLYDHAIDPYALQSQVQSAQAQFKSVGITVTVSDMAYGFKTAGDGGVAVLQTVDNVHGHMLPFFSPDATTGDNAWPIIDPDIQWLQTTAGDKKIYLSENGWPSTSYEGVQATSGAAVADVSSEAAYFNLLDSKCEYFKSFPHGIAWFAHLYSDNQEPGYGILDSSGNEKFPFKPKTSC